MAHAAQVKIPATYMRGGTSKGVFFRLQDLPEHLQVGWFVVGDQQRRAVAQVGIRHGPGPPGGAAPPRGRRAGGGGRGGGPGLCHSAISF